MRCVTGAILVVITAAPAAQSGEEAVEQTPREQYQALLKEYSDYVRRINDPSGEAEAPGGEREGQWPEDKFAGRLLDLARKHPKDPVVLNSLAWIISKEAYPGALEAIAILSRDHVRSERIGAILPDLEVYALVKNAETLFREVLERNPYREVRGVACLSLARYLKLKTEAIKNLDKPDGRWPLQDIEASYGPVVVRQLRATDPAEMIRETEELFERVCGQYADIKYEDGTLGGEAESELFELRNLGIGKVAPEIKGRDLDGTPLRLSDYRGKVVVLNFWSHEFCGVCRKMYPHERSLVERLRDKPFVLLGINNDSDREEVRAVMERERLDWHAWWDPGDPFGPIATKWNIRSWPTIFVLDHQGVIRYRDVTGERLEEAVDGLLREQEQASKPRP